MNEGVEAGGSGPAPSPAPSPVPGLVPVPACPVCEEPSSAVLFTAGDVHLGVPGSYTYRRCAACRTVYQSPRVADEDLGLAYPAEYATHFAPRPPAFQADSQRPARGLRERLREGIRAVVTSDSRADLGVIGRVLASSRWMRERAFYDLGEDEILPWKQPPGRVLDVGCGAGRIMLRMAAMGWEVEGLEWDRAAASVAAENTGLPVHVGTAEHPDPGLGCFDLLLLMHVFEHLPRPVAALARLSELLAPGGRLVLVYPNSASLAARRFGRDWFPWEVPRHLTLAPVAGVRAAAGRAGLAVRSARTSARWAGHYAAQSRATREGRSPYEPVLTRGDRAFRVLAGLLVALGRHVGEEVIVSLERAPAGGRGP